MPKNKLRIQIDGSRYVNINVATNQKVVCVKKVHPKSYILDVHSNRKALKDLSAVAYKLYMYFILNVPGFTEAMSPQNVIAKTGLSERTYYKAVNELIAAKYLVRVPHASFKDYYELHESAQIIDNNI